MLVFFIHGVSTKKSTYAEALIKNIKKEVRKTKVETSLYFYSSFWGNLFNHKKHQLIDYIDKDYSYSLNKRGRTTYSGTILCHLRLVIKQFTPDY